MKLRSETAPLRNAVSKLIRLIPAKVTIPILGTISIQCRDNEATISATNMDCALTIKIPVECDNGEVAIPGTQFAAFLEGLPDGDVSIEATDKSAKLVSGYRQAKLQVLPFADAPVMPFDFPGAVEFPLSEPIIEAMSRLIPACGDDVNRPFLAGVHLIAKNGRLIIEATDLKIGGQFFFEADKDFEITIPKFAVQIFPKIFDAGTLYIAPEKISISDGSATFVSKVCVSGFPDIERNLPQKSVDGLTISLDAERLLKSSEAIIKVVGDQHKFITPGLQIKAHDGFVVISCPTIEGTSAEDRVQAECEINSHADFGTLLRNISDLFGMLKPETISFNQSEIGKVVRLDIVGSDNRLGFFMPFKI